MMDAFVLASLPQEAFDPVAMAKKFNLTPAQAEEQVQRMKQKTVYMNSTYQVDVILVRAPFGAAMGDMKWLSIKRKDRDPIRDWRELQQIKNAIVGEECEGFEMYPAESRLVDTSNQYHLWVFVDPAVRMPVGFRDRLVYDSSQAKAVGAKQR